MDKASFKLVGSPCGHHGQYTFYKALRLTGDRDRILAIGDFFFVRLWQDSELVSVGELQLLWRDRVSDQTLVSLRLYCLPENTPDGRNTHGEDEVLAISEKVVIKAEDLLSWVCSGEGWSCGLKAVWRGECAPHADALPTSPLHQTKLDFSDVEKEKMSLPADASSPGVVVFSYPRYCRYRALVSRLAGVSGRWLRHALVAALGGYSADTDNTRILYCKDTFEYPELEGHEFVCNHMAPRLKGRPRGRRRRPPRSHSPSSHDSDSGNEARSEGYQPTRPIEPKTSRRISLRNGTSSRPSSEEEDAKPSRVTAKERAADRAFVKQLRVYSRTEPHSVRDLSLRSLYSRVSARGGYETVCKHRLWRDVHAAEPAAARDVYERFLLSYENQERRNGKHFRSNGKIELKPAPTIDTIDVPDSPSPTPEPENLCTDRTSVQSYDDETHKYVDEHKHYKHEDIKHKYKETNTTNQNIEDLSKLRERSVREIEFQDVSKPEASSVNVKIDNETGEIKEENLKDVDVSKPAEELNKEFLDSLPKNENKDNELKITLKPVEKLLDTTLKDSVVKLFEDNKALVQELSMKHNQNMNRVLEDIEAKQIGDSSSVFLSELAQRLSLGSTESPLLELAKNQELSTTLAVNRLNGHTDNRGNRPAGRSSLRAVRVKPARPNVTGSGGTTPQRRDSPPLSPPSAPQPPPLPLALPPVTNMGIHHPPGPPHSDDEIVEVPYKPKTPEIIDLDEYPESPQAFKKKKLEILKERGLEVTAVPSWGSTNVSPLTPLITPSPILLNPTMQHQIMTQASLFQMYNIIPQNYANGIQPPKVIQATSIYGTTGPEKTVYGNPKDPFMPPPHILQGIPVKPRVPLPEPRDILDLSSNKVSKPAVEIVKLPSSSPISATNVTKTSNYTLMDGKAVVGSNLEITLVNPKTSTSTSPLKAQPNRPPQKRSSNGKFMSSKTNTPPKEIQSQYIANSRVDKPSPSKHSPHYKKPAINIPSYPIRDEPSPTSSTGSRDSANNIQAMQNSLMKQQSAQNNLSQMIEMQKSLPMSPFIDPMYMSALYSSLSGQMDRMDHRQLALYRDFMASQFRGYTGLLGNTPTTKN